MRKFNGLWILAGILIASMTVGCGSSDTTISKDKDADLRHPTADPNYKGPSKEGLDKMNSQIQSYAEKHKDDKVEFNTGK